MFQDHILSPQHLEIVLILTMGSILATFFGYVTERLKLSAILGYLLAGYCIGPYSPGFVANQAISEQLAEIGVILMMFWVGLHLKWQELIRVKNIAIFGAIIQTLCATVFGAIVVHLCGWPLEAGIILGLSIGIASTVVLVRVLSDNNLQYTKSGHISLSWLIGEDFIAVFALLLLPLWASITAGQALPWHDLITSMGLVFVKFAIWTILLFTLGRRLVSFLLNKVLHIKVVELFTLATLALIFSITIGTAVFTGTSIALGAFIAGMLVGQTALLHQISTSLMPMRDAFVVFFFLSIGMLFNPLAVLHNMPMFLGMLSVILLIKPLAAWTIVHLFKFSSLKSLTVALALAQIGEFSFILVEEATRLKMIPEEGYDVIVACAFISLALNPLLFKLLIRYSQKSIDNF